jgi:hypothetical protein
MKIKNYKPLRLIAADADDVEVISAVLQDAVMKVGDMAFLKAERRFALVANRFIWEEGASKRFGPFTRVRAGVHFDDVLNVRSRNVRQDAKDAVVSLLAVRYQPNENGPGEVTLELAGGGEIVLQVDALNAVVTDISEPWRTQSKPEHNA